MVDLRVLYLKGNPCAKKIPNYRKGITAVCGNLKPLSFNFLKKNRLLCLLKPERLHKIEALYGFVRYLDDRPVFPEARLEHMQFISLQYFVLNIALQVCQVLLPLARTDEQLKPLTGEDIGLNCFSNWTKWNNSTTATRLSILTHGG